MASTGVREREKGGVFFTDPPAHFFVPALSPTADVAIQRLLWGGVGVAVLTADDPAKSGATVEAGDGTRVVLPRGAVVVHANDDTCFR